MAFFYCLIHDTTISKFEVLFSRCVLHYTFKIKEEFILNKYLFMEL